MARKRYLKPGFFKNEDLASLPPLVRILFQGLWCYADREGRLEDRPMRLKSDIIPYDNFNVNSGLNRLQEKNFIIRYKFLDGKKENSYIQIIKFKEHQDVHINEQQSTIPAPVLHGASTVEVPHNNGSYTPLNLELRTLNLEDVVVDNAREAEIENAINDFLKDTEVEKEKNVAPKKENIPSTEEIIEKIVKSGTCHWRNAVEFYLAVGVKWNKITDLEKQPFYDKRAELFKKFYATKTDNYKIRLPSCNEIAQNFYNWIPSELNRENIQILNKSAIEKSLIHTTNSPVKSITAIKSDADFMKLRGYDEFIDKQPS